jgi:hypothetical protein
MDNLLEKLQSLKGVTIDDNMITQLLQAAQSSAGKSPVRAGFDDICRSDVDHVDDILVASRAAELELESMRRYFSNPSAKEAQGIDGLADEDLSSDSEDESLELKAEESVLDKLLAKNSMVAINDEEEETQSVDDLATDVDMSHIPTTVVIPYGAQFVPLGKVISVVDNLLVIGEVNPVEAVGSEAVPTHSVACDVESMVFLAGSEALEVVGMIVDTLGTVRHPMHLVLVSNKALIERLKSSSQLIGTSVCSLTSHSRVVEVDQIGGHLAIRGCPQIAELEDYDDDGADDDEAVMPVMTPKRSQPPPPPPQRRFNGPHSYRR